MRVYFNKFKLKTLKRVIKSIDAKGAFIEGNNCLVTNGAVGMYTYAPGKEEKVSYISIESITNCIKMGDKYIKYDSFKNERENINLIKDDAILMKYQKDNYLKGKEIDHTYLGCIDNAIESLTLLKKNGCTNIALGIDTENKMGNKIFIYDHSSNSISTLFL